jgi:hypothetical protein
VATDTSLAPIIIPAIIAAAAVITIVTNWYYHRTQEKRSRKYEQFRICREIWNEILKQNRFIHEWPIEGANDRMKLKRYMELLKNDLDYFVFFVEKGELYEPSILQYYRKKVSSVKANVGEISKYHPTYIDVKDYQETKDIMSLIDKYYGLTARFKEEKEDNEDKDKEPNSSKN